MKIALMGCSGSGKTTFARELERELGYPVIELDGYFHQANWTPAEDSAFVSQVGTAMAESEKSASGWIVDGNYLSKLGDLIVSQADVVIWFNLPRRTVMQQIIKRSLQRAFTRKVLWNQNKESFRNLLKWSPELNIVRWAWTQHGTYAEKLNRLATAAGTSQLWIEIRNEKDQQVAYNYLASINL